MVQSVLSRCDLLYFSVHVSTVWKYGQSLNKVIDYMLAGKPVVLEGQDKVVGVSGRTFGLARGGGYQFLSVQAVMLL